MPITFVTTSAQHLHTHKRHPERTERIQVILDVIRQDALLAAQWVTAQAAPMTAITRIHDSAYVQSLADACAGLPSDYVAYADTYTTQATYLAACQAAGAACQAADLMMTGHAAFALCRPPGHHATAAEAMGFCFFNNIAIAAYHALEVHGLERVLIVDFDVHHGNGTEEIFASDDRVLMVSTFEHALYPFTGDIPMGGNMVNIPLPAYSDGQAMRQAVEQHWLPAIDKFQPQLVLISAGFDAHREDDMSHLKWTDLDYAWISQQLVQVAARHCGRRLVSSLEGGYAIEALARSVGHHVDALLCA